ncbi:MAG: Hpt domain-containing protein [Bacteroidales bacterium]|jgi:HPt (histidine-containing phosphotransfer) domain-containing protein|nr:Hpt domain-containing protein [Bacteroidales bacterium]
MEYAFIKTDYLEMVTGRDAAITEELVTIFRNQVVEFYEQMAALNKERRYSELGQLAHKAKSSVSIIGMEKMATTLKLLEQNSKTATESKDFSNEIESFRIDTREALRELDHYLKTL